jgi:hypothetical protein
VPRPLLGVRDHRGELPVRVSPLAGRGGAVVRRREQRMREAHPVSRELDEPRGEGTLEVGLHAVSVARRRGQYGHCRLCEG